jgi:hypothetical protein
MGAIAVCNFVSDFVSDRFIIALLLSNCSRLSFARLSYLGYVIIDTNYQLEILAINYLSVVKR